MFLLFSFSFEFFFLFEYRQPAMITSSCAYKWETKHDKKNRDLCRIQRNRMFWQWQDIKEHISNVLCLLLVD